MILNLEMMIIVEEKEKKKISTPLTWQYALDGPLDYKRPQSDVIGIAGKMSHQTQLPYLRYTPYEE